MRLGCGRQLSRLSVAWRSNDATANQGSKNAYRMVFNTPDGKRVLADLQSRCNIG